MINKLEIQGVNMELDSKLFAYASKKIGRLDRYTSRHSRESMHAQVFLKEQKLKSRKNNVCEVVLKLPGETIAVKESTVNMYAAIDIVEDKLKNKLKKYKEKHSHNKFHHRMLARIKRQT